MTKAKIRITANPKSATILTIAPEKTVSIKQAGVSATVENFRLEDMRKICDYFKDKKTGNNWLHYLALMIEANTGIRNVDVLKLRWSHFFKPNGQFRQYLEVNEQKTGKNNCPKINDYLKKVINEFIENTGIDPSAAGYSLPIFIQQKGAHKGEVITYNACYRAIKRAADKLGIEYDTGTHSARKFFGATMYETHQSDHDSKDMIQEMLNHSDQKTTNRYIGLTREKKNQYYDDLGEFFENHIDGCKDFSEKAYVKADYKELKSLIEEAFVSGTKCENTEDCISGISDLIAKLNEIVG